MASPNYDDDFYPSDLEDSDFHSDSDSSDFGYTPATGSHGTQIFDTSVNRLEAATEHRGLKGRPDHHDPALQPATPYIYRPYSYSRNYLPEENFRPMAARFPESGDPFATRRAFETPSVTQPRPNLPLARRGDNENKAATSTKSVHNAPRHKTGPTRTKTLHRFTPYETCPTRATECVDSEAGLSTLPPRISTVGSPTTRPPGGLSTTTASAEEEETPKQTGPVKRKPVESTAKLVEWARRKTGLRARLTINDALTIAIEAIDTIKKEPSTKPCLKSLNGKSKRNGSDARSCELRHDIKRKLYEDLSRYYPRERGLWGRPALLSKLLADLEAHPELLPPPK